MPFGFSPALAFLGFVRSSKASNCVPYSSLSVRSSWRSIMSMRCTKKSASALSPVPMFASTAKPPTLPRTSGGNALRIPSHSPIALTSLVCRTLSRILALDAESFAAAACTIWSRWDFASASTDFLRSANLSRIPCSKIFARSLASRSTFFRSAGVCAASMRGRKVSALSCNAFSNSVFSSLDTSAIFPARSISTRSVAGAVSVETDERMASSASLFSCMTREKLFLARW